jgi:alpha-glucosidase
MAGQCRFFAARQGQNEEKVSERGAKNSALDVCRRALFVQPEPVGGFGVEPRDTIFKRMISKMNKSDEFWWRNGIFYQIYPRSFQDSDGNGVGDIAGIIDRLPYLVALGVDAVWLSPIFPSPMVDFGYDISNYTGIDPLFGSMDDFDRLVDAAHAAGLKVILDLVPNHTSDQHPWFIESRGSRDNPKRDWYLWRDPGPDGSAPNNWLSEFGGSAWQYDTDTGQYYYHAFLAQQPDLNWRNSAVRQAIYDVMRFWLRKGVDGFRVDVIWHLIKDAEFRDNPPNPYFREGRPPHEKILTRYSTDQPEVLNVVAEMRRVVDEFDSRVLIGEIYLPVERLVAYYGNDLKGAQMPFNFALLSTLWSARSIERIIAQYEAALPAGAWPNWVLGNHDRPRVASRVGQDQARVAAMLLLTLRGTPTLYYGDEIGMHQVAIAPDQVRDPFEKNVPGIGVGRDGCRTPMQWDATPQAGFSTVTPWLPLPDDYLHENVVNLDADTRSILNLYKALIRLRRKLPQLVSGTYQPIAAEADLLLYRRQSEAGSVVIALNLGAEPVSIASDVIGLGGEILLSTLLDREGERIEGVLDLRSNEGAVIGPAVDQTG